ncbi:MAG: cytochrome c biogenesis protein CcsA [Acidobacteria bacterium]|nr:cytochrome c biogenesis protein CcsA [Acidobacteriota bacterium]
MGLGSPLGFAPGTVAMWAALVFGVLCALTYWRAMRVAAATAGGPALLPFEEIPSSSPLLLARRLYYAFTFSVVLASVLLMGRLLSHDFRLSYVSSYSGRDLPYYYLFSTFWAGQEGSFLLWLFFGSLIGLFVLRSAKEQEPPVMIVYVASFIGIVAILVKQSPFRFLGQIPPDGQGLNPLLQDPWMVIHPPVMFSGFASLSVPFAFAIAALWMKRWDGWVVRAMPWALFTFVTLGTAILMGGYWAYKTLGWGGYWAWDPVENTSLVPWLATVALVHGMFLQKAREKHRKINIILAILAFCCILYGTFLTRSGVLADFSVHSFIDLGITGWLVAIIVVFLVGGLGLLAFRWKEIPVVSDLDAAGKEKEEPFLSRSVLFILSVTLFSASGLVILLGTSAPILTRIGGKASQVSTSFYNVTHAPIAALMAFLVALVPFLSWRGETLAVVAKKAFVAAAIGLMGGGVAFAAGVHSVRDLAILSFAVFGMAANAQTVALFVRRKAVSTVGGYLAHVGVSIMLVGILVSGVYETKQQINLPKGQPTQVGRHTMTFTKVVFVNEKGDVKQPEELNMLDLNDRRAKQAMEVEVASPSGKVWKAYPKMYMNQRTQQMMANPDVRSTPLMDLYVSPQSYDPGQPARVEGSTIALKKGESKSADGIKIKFLDFSADRSAINDATRPHVTVTANFLVTTAEAAEEKTAKFVMYFGATDGGQATEAPDTPLPGKGRMRIKRVSPNEGTCELELMGVAAGGDLKPATAETLSIDVTTKPLISLVWGGFYVMMLGGLVALLRRAKDSRQAAVA